MISVSESEPTCDGGGGVLLLGGARGGRFCLSHRSGCGSLVRPCGRCHFCVL